MNKIRRLFYDTCFYIDWFHENITHNPLDHLQAPTLIVGHGIVFMELYQGVRNDREEKAIKELEKSLTLIGPSIENYLQAGHILKEMTKRKWLQSSRLFEMQNDVLLALSAVEQEALMITRNRKDFERIKMFCPLTVFYYN